MLEHLSTNTSQKYRNLTLKLTLIRRSRNKQFTASFTHLIIVSIVSNSISRVRSPGIFCRCLLVVLLYVTKYMESDHEESTYNEWLACKIITTGLPLQCNRNVTPLINTNRTSKACCHIWSGIICLFKVCRTRVYSRQIRVLGRNCNRRRSLFLTSFWCGEKVWFELVYGDNHLFIVH